MTERNNKFVAQETPKPESGFGNWLERAGVAETEIGRVIQAKFAAPEALEQYRARPIEAADTVDRADVEVYREVLDAIMDELKTSDTVRKARAKVKESGYESLDELDREGLLRAFDRARKRAIAKVEMSGRQANKLRFAVTSELNYSLRYYIHEGTPEDWMILDPELRPIDFMGSTEVLRYLRNSLTPSADVAFVESNPDVPPDVKEAVAEAELAEAA